MQCRFSTETIETVYVPTVQRLLGASSCYLNGVRNTHSFRGVGSAGNTDCTTMQGSYNSFAGGGSLRPAQMNSLFE